MSFLLIYIYIYIYVSSLSLSLSLPPTHTSSSSLSTRYNTEHTEYGHRSNDPEKTFECKLCHTSVTKPSKCMAHAIMMPTTPMSWITTKNNNSSKAEVWKVTGNVVEKSLKDAYIDNIESQPSSGSFKFTIEIMEVKKHDAWNAIGVRDPNQDSHLRSTHGCCVQIQTGNIYVSGTQKSGTSIGAVNKGDKITVIRTPGNVTFQHSNGKTATVPWNPPSSRSSPALAARALGWKFKGNWVSGTLPPPKPVVNCARGTSAHPMVYRTGAYNSWICDVCRASGSGIRWHCPTHKSYVFSVFSLSLSFHLTNLI